MKLREYQEEAVEAVFETWKKFRRVLIVLPTGCGKTIVFSSVIKRLLAQTGRILVLAHREELVTQAKEKVERLVPSADVQVEMGEFAVGDYFGRKCDVVVSTVQTQLNRRTKFDPDDFAAVVVDEAHHAVAKSYRETVDHYLRNPDCRLLGVTATPDRADETALRNAFDAVAYEYTVAAAIEDGWLVPVRQKLVKVESLDFSGVSTSAGDLNSAELAEVMEDERNLHGIVAPVLEICRGRKAILFAASVKQAERICEIVNRAGTLRADWISGATPKDVRRQKLAAFRRGETDVMCNVGVLTEGFDDAGVEVVVMARPTKSRALYAQMAGRATRPAAEIAAKLGELEVEKVGGGGQRNLTSCSAGQHKEEGDRLCPPPPAFSTSPAAARRALIAASSKPSCLIVDFVGNSGRHKLVTTVDILGGKDLDETDEEVRAAAKRKIEEGGEADASEALAEARKEIEARKAREAKRRAFVRATAKFTAIDVDPMNVYDLPPVEARPGDEARHFSLRQEAILRRMRVDPETVAYRMGLALIEEDFRRRRDGVQSLLQQRWLRRFGIPVPMTREEAKRTLTKCFKGD